ncbi:helix-turn-helix domain-containing protein [Streptomyces sp. WMMC905]|uniref:helix-turn-helix domain-containing protein n=1 Tax=Streptomyces sp. WMMC905 TaxID=3404123 RepID=UPI003B9243BC
MTRPPACPLPTPAERRRLRLAASLTRQEVAERVGVTPETVRAWEAGRTNPSGRRRAAYAHLLKTLEAKVTVAQETSVGDHAVERPGDPLTNEGTDRSGSPSPRRPPAPAPGQAATHDGHASGTTPLPRLARRDEGATGPGARDSTPPPASPSGVGPARRASAVAVGATTPAQAFDALYTGCAPALLRQAYLLTGRRELARESVERSFHGAWERWPEVARDPDPAGRVRMAVHEYALSPWHRFRRRHRDPEPPPADPTDRALLGVLLSLPPAHRRTLVLCDGLGIGTAEAAAETEATTPAAVARLRGARTAVANRLPALADPEALRRGLTALAGAERLRSGSPASMRTISERRARFLTRTAIVCTAALIGATALTAGTAPTRYEPPVASGDAVRGVPPRQAQGSLSEEARKLRAALDDHPLGGPHRLTPQAR